MRKGTTAMQSQNRFFDDLAKVAGGALGALSNLKQEMEAMVRERVERFMAENNMVPREEFDAVKAMAAEARVQQERLAARVAALEAALAEKNAAPPR
jgi:BMFP domain-containing protein YqiC